MQKSTSLFCVGKVTKTQSTKNGPRQHTHLKIWGEHVFPKPSKSIFTTGQFEATKMYRKKKRPCLPQDTEITQVFHLPPFLLGHFRTWVSCVVSTKVPKHFDSSGGVTNYLSTNFRCTPSTLAQVENKSAMEKNAGFGGLCISQVSHLTSMVLDAVKPATNML